MTVEAVFCGHTHQDHIFYGVHTNLEQPGNIKQPWQYEDPMQPYNLAFDSTDSPYYIETNTACKNYP